MYLAHSAKDNIPSQLYKTHIENNHSNIINILERLKNSLSKDLFDLLSFITITANYYHDIGKLDSQCQSVLKGECNDKMINHVDPGVAIVINIANSIKDNKKRNLYFTVAHVIHAHHIGLSDYDQLFDKKPFSDINVFAKTGIRDYSDLSKYNLNTIENINIKVKDYFDSKLDYFLEIQRNEIDINLPNEPIIGYKENELLNDPSFVRLCLSVLVDADHTDTTENYFPLTKNAKIYSYNGNEYKKNLDNYRKTLPTDGERNNIRTELFNECSIKNMKNAKFVFLPGLVGTGKTLGFFSMALNSCEENNNDGQIYVAPFKNIIFQLCDQISKVLLDNKNSYNLINEVHSDFDFSSIDARHLSKKWNTPFTVTTAVQFFESMISCHPSKIRKFHNYINKTIVIDEYHLLNLELIPLFLKTIVFLGEHCNTHFIFSSACYIKFWELDSLFSNLKNELDYFDESLSNVLENKSVYAKMEDQEVKRINILDIGSINTEDLVKSVISKSQNNKSSLIILNTINNAKNVYNELSKNSDNKIVFLTNSKTPTDMKKAINNMKKMLKNKEKFFCVATSCIECGIDVSFDIGFRQTASIDSIDQTKGRINRNCEAKSAFLCVFDLESSSQYECTSNPTIRPEIDAFKEYKKNHSIGDQVIIKNDKITEYKEISLKKEKIDKANRFCEKEKDLKFKYINDNVKMIPMINITVIVDKWGYIENKIINQEYISYRTLQKNSVSVNKERFKKMQNNGLIKQIDFKENEVLYIYNGKYTDELGYAADEKVFARGNMNQENLYA